jgi:dipeptidase E
MSARQIVGAGGGISEPVRDYVLGLAGRQPPRVLWVGTASAEDPRETLRILDLHAGLAQVTRLEFFPWPPAEARRVVLQSDVILVGGGNTANLLAVWRVHGFDAVLRDAWEAGVVLAGWSAGLLCWFEGGVTDSFGPQLGPIHDGLGFLPGSCCPHYDDEELRRPVYRDLVDRGQLPPGLAADADAALHFVGRELHAVVASQPGKRAYRVEPGREVPLEAALLS